jgi:hypothetical protein
MDLHKNGRDASTVCFGIHNRDLGLELRLPKLERIQTFLSMGKSKNELGWLKFCQVDFVKLTHHK